MKLLFQVRGPSLGKGGSIEGVNESPRLDMGKEHESTV